jgi:hypothetical protein
MIKTILWMVCAVGALEGCGKNKEDKRQAAAEAKAVAATPEATPKPPGGPWQLDAAGVQAKLQGAWVLKNVAYAGSVEAWEIKGDKIRMWDGKQSKESTATLSLSSPCQLALKSGSDAAGWETTYATFAFDGDKLYLGLGQAGVKQGDAIIACTSRGTFVMKGTDCKVYKENFGHMEAQDGAKCALEGDTLKVSAPGDSSASELKVQNSVLLDEQMRNPFSPPQRVASYDEAKAQAK